MLGVEPLVTEVAMQLLDVTVPLRPGMVVFDGDPPVRLERVASLAGGDAVNLSRLDFGVHSGTHVDAPVHFIDGAGGVETLPLDAMVGPALVADGSGLERHIDAAALAGLGIPAGTERVLFKTPNSALWALGSFSPDFLALTESGAQALIDLGVRLVGIDYLSVAPFGDPGPVHRALLGAGVVVVEGLDLRAADPGPCQLWCLPARIDGCDGAPARAVIGR
jgi:arylformamidase